MQGSHEPTTREESLHDHPVTQQDPTSEALATTTVGIPELDALCDAGLITRVHAQLTSGKEGTVYCCRAHSSTRRRFVAAKVYRQHAASTYKRDAMYFEGRERVLKERTLRAIRSGSSFGRTVAAELWVDAEYSHLQRLAAAGARTPAPVARSGRVILMEYIGNGAGPAPQLHGVDLDHAAAEQLLRQIVRDAAVMLRHHLVHGDLSPYNILVWRDEARIIDLPQAVDARFNRSAPELLQRDLRNLAAFFRRHGVDLDAEALSVRLWEQYLRGQL
jgi:RIO kinase 1